LWFFFVSGKFIGFAYLLNIDELDLPQSYGSHGSHGNDSVSLIICTVW
jgi:hypothetical protein